MVPSTDHLNAKTKVSAIARKINDPMMYEMNIAPK